ncbi:MAG: hypothetical protein M3209_01790 [Acidobacteriota bacterium]|nr:hypothetical protein [Acidobacteriota bacterium]
MAFLKAAGLLGSLLTLIALMIAFLRQLIDLVGFVMMAVKFVLLVGFIGLFLFIGLVAYRTFRQRKRERDGDEA